MADPAPAAMVDSLLGRSIGHFRVDSVLGQGGIRTVNELGRRPTFSRALVRSLVKLWGPIAAAIIDFIVFNGGAALRLGRPLPKGSTDSGLAATLLWLVWASMFFTAIGKARATPHDRVAHTRVIVDLGT